MRRLAWAMLPAVLLAAACSPLGDDVPTVVVSVYPVEEAAARVAGELAAVVNITPPGADAHDLELAARDLARIEAADLVVVVGGGFQPGVEQATAKRAATLVLLDEVTPPSGEVDPHLWLDPTVQGRIADLIADRLAAVDPDNEAIYRANAAAYGDELDALDAAFDATIATCDDEIVVASHRAYGWLAARYGLVLEGIAGLSPEAEPTAERLAELRNEIARTGVTTIFTEPLASSRAAETLARDADLDLAELDPLEGLTDAKRAAGATYESIMRDNLAALARGLGCDLPEQG